MVVHPGDPRSKSRQLRQLLGPAYNSTDEPGYLITPDKVMTVQLVAYDDVIQYIVDGKLNYQIGGGEETSSAGTRADC